ncbi:MAG: D-glycero-beta-D-manno-heptose-7-phosphate kinase [Nitrospinae bacterium]|nr:D-glycero-beta-D-manno-heptose-7-phosphate kinase [Nitrospinota bacterium]
MNKLFDHVTKLKSSPRILVVGDMILDDYIWGTVSRISPEAPVQVVEQQRNNFALGGAANVANNLSTLNCKVEMLGVIGDDDNGKKLLKLLRKAGISTKPVIVVPGRPTTIKTRVIAHNQQILRIDKEDKTSIDKEHEALILKKFDGIIKDIDGIIISDYLKGVVTKKVATKIIKQAKKHNKIVIADPKGKDLSKLKGSTIITPNLKEIKEAAPIKISSEQEIERAIQYIFGLLDLDYILLTRSEKGMTLYKKDGGSLNIPTTAREVYDVTGAGDTVISVLMMGLVTGLEIEDSCKLANRAAGIAVGKIGASSITLDEIIDELKENINHSGKKVVSWESITRIASFLKNHKKKIVFTNGCFDLLHYGHIKYLQDAKALGDVLIVGLNSDSSVQRLKGKKRPLINEKERAKLLAAMDCIDYVVIFSEDTPLEIIKTVGPDILVKGGDYTPDEVVGKEQVEKYGGKVKIIPLVKNLSTSTIVDKIVKLNS